jgi:Na+/phosphate symporter
MSMLGEDLDSAQWRIFRLFLVDLEDEDVKQVSEQLDKELQARQDCENSAVRLFFSSLAAGDLEQARQAILNEQAARAQERRTLASLAPGRKRRKPAAR